MMFKIEWKEEAVKELSKLEKNISSRIYKTVSKLKEDFKSMDIKRVQGTNLLRLRIGDYRVLFEIDKDNIIILKVGHRKNIYKS